MTRPYLKAKEKLEKNKIYTITEAIDLVKKIAPEKFDSSIEVHCHLGINPKKSDQQLKISFTLPHGTGKTKRIAAFVSPDKEKEAKEAGADIVGGDELIEEIKKTEKTDFDVSVANPDMMRKLASIAKILGTRGLMPSPKNDTVTQNIAKAIKELKGGKVTTKNDDTSNIHQIIGKKSFTKEQLEENFNAFIDTIRKNKPSSSKGNFFRSITVCSSMGPAIKVNLP